MALSCCQKQRFAIASAIASDAEIMLFDEPASGLDYSHMEKVGELLKKIKISKCLNLLILRIKISLGLQKLA
ncbi:MAG: hypothetical protein K5881_03250 [Saccharofermentans sp.]|nr:hypothetical protein [Saccharofermentans sp.]